jgi:diguanylate cyclase (GGDEF)-like protein
VENLEETKTQRGKAPALPILITALTALALLFAAAAYSLLRQGLIADLAPSAEALVKDIRPALRYGNRDVAASAMKTSILIPALIQARLTDAQGGEIAQFAPPDAGSGIATATALLDIDDSGKPLGQLRLTVSTGRLLGFSMGLAALLWVVGSILLTWYARSRRALAMELARKQEEIRDLAHHCPLTGLPNRKLFADRLAHAMANHEREKQMLAVLMLDLSSFKLINDLHGTKVGDKVLRHVARLLPNTLRSADTVSRVGGDEFAMIVEHATETKAARIAEKILQAVDSTVRVGDKKILLASNIGIALYPKNGEDIESLLRQAETALRHAAEGAKNTYSFFTPDMNAHAQRELELEAALRKALKRQELSLHYQPQVDVKTRRVVGLEALLRWNSKKLGLIMPEEIIPLAETSGLINPIGVWVLNTACAQAAKWHAMALAGSQELLMSVNLSARQLLDPNIVGTVRHALEESGLSPQLLVLEITESSLTHPDPAIIERLNALVDMGMALALDDFGTGYSSLSYLKRFPITKLKIDGSFVAALPDNPDDVAITSAIIGMGRGLNMELIAEGVETEEQMRFLAAKGCNLIQGFLFGHPLPADEAEKLVQQVNAPYLAD